MTKLRNCCQCCKHSEFDDGDPYQGEGPQGWSCTKRNYKTSTDEWRHLDQMNDPSYLAKAKKCFESVHK